MSLGYTRTARRRVAASAIVLGLGLAACGGADDTAGPDASESTPEETQTPTEDVTDEPSEGGNGDMQARPLDAPAATITVDGDASDWADVPVLEMTLEAISGEDVDSRDARIRVAHDDENIYVLFEVDDDYNWDADDAHLSASSAVMWGIDPGAAEHMGAEDDDRDTSLGMVDIWHWELECGPGEESGGAVSDAGEGDPGNDAGCNFDDEWATMPEEREDDNTETGENSLLGVFSHTDATDDAPGTWIFEISRPLDTGDSQDAQFTVGSTANLALAYWDPDQSVEGWEDDGHVQSANQGWIEITLI